MKPTTTHAATIDQAEVTQYMRDLQSFDWSYEYSDDPFQQRKAKLKLNDLYIQQARLDPTGKIWSMFKPGDHGPSARKVLEVKRG